MKVFRIRPTSGEDILFSPSKQDNQCLSKSDRTPEPLQCSWRPVRFSFHERSIRGESDLPYIGADRLCLRDRAQQVLGESLRPHGEFLRATLEDAESLSIFHCTDVAPSLDVERSQVSYFANGRIKRVRTFWFNEKIIGRRASFRVPELQSTFFTDQLVDYIAELELSGASFLPVWDSDWTESPVPVLIISGFWRAQEWAPAESAKQALGFLRRLGDLESALENWQMPGGIDNGPDSMRLELSEPGLSEALSKIGERRRNSDAIYFDRGIRNLPDTEIKAEFSTAFGNGKRLVNSQWGGVAHVRLLHLLQEKTRHATAEGVLRIFDAMRKSWPIDHLVARTNLQQSPTDLKIEPMIGWITSLRSPGDSSLPDPALPNGVSILDRTPEMLTIRIGAHPDELSTMQVTRVLDALSAQGWLPPTYLREKPPQN